MKMRMLLCAFVTLVAGCGNHATMAPPPVNALAPNALHSPWDMHPVTPREGDYNCGTISPPAPNISILDESYRSGDKSAASESVKNAAYAESSAAVEDYSALLSRAADDYQNRGNLGAARCVAIALEAGATAHSMTGWMSSRSALYAQSRGLRGVSTAYLKIRPSGVLTPQQSNVLLDWMQAIVGAQRDYFDHAGCTKSRCDDHNHRALNAAYAVMSVGVAANDRSDFNWGVHKYRLAVDDIDQGGMLHADLGSVLSMKFLLEATASLVQMAEYAELNGEPLYAYDGGRIHLLVHVVTRGLVDSTPVEIASGHRKQKLPNPMQGWEIGWAAIYVQRFPDGVISGLVQQAGDSGKYVWGGAPFGLDNGE